MIYDLANLVDRMLSLQEKRDWRTFARNPWQDVTEGVFPKVNLYKKDDQLTLTAELPGVEKADLDIQVKGVTLTIKGRRVAAAEDSSAYTHRERGAFEFERSIKLPFEVKTEEIKADYQNGLLVLTLPRAEDGQAHKVVLN